MPDFHSKQSQIRVKTEDHLKGYTCDICNKNFKLGDSLEIHRKKHDLNLTASSINERSDGTCDSATQKFSLLANIYACNMCGAKLGSVLALDEHVRKHDDEQSANGGHNETINLVACSSGKNYFLLLFLYWQSCHSSAKRYCFNHNKTGI